MKESGDPVSSHDHATERSLVSRARDGDQAAFADLASLHRAKLWSICLRTTGNEYDAEDALQDALTAAWLNLGRFRGEASFGTWAYRIAANAALAVVRRRRDQPMDPMDQLDAVDRGDGHDFTVSVAVQDQVSAALATLPETFREALVLREYGDLTYEQISAHQAVPVQTVKSRLNRARRALAEQLRAEV